MKVYLVLFLVETAQDQLSFIVGNGRLGHFFPRQQYNIAAATAATVGQGAPRAEDVGLLAKMVHFCTIFNTTETVSPRPTTEK